MPGDPILGIADRLTERSEDGLDFRFIPTDLFARNTFFGKKSSYCDRLSQVPTNYAVIELPEDSEPHAFRGPHLLKSARRRQPIRVFFDDAATTLEGTVDSYQKRTLVKEVALEAGAMRVINKLEVASGGPAERASKDMPAICGTHSL